MRCRRGVAASRPPGPVPTHGPLPDGTGKRVSVPCRTELTTERTSVVSKNERERGVGAGPRRGRVPPAPPPEREEREGDRVVGSVGDDRAAKNNQKVGGREGRRGTLVSERMARTASRDTVTFEQEGFFCPSRGGGWRHQAE